MPAPAQSIAIKMDVLVQRVPKTCTVYWLQPTDKQVRPAATPAPVQPTLTWRTANVRHAQWPPSPSMAPTKLQSVTQEALNATSVHVPCTATMTGVRAPLVQSLLFTEAPSLQVRERWSAADAAVLPMPTSKKRLLLLHALVSTVAQTPCHFSHRIMWTTAGAKPTSIAPVLLRHAAPVLRTPHRSRTRAPASAVPGFSTRTKLKLSLQ